MYCRMSVTRIMRILRTFYAVPLVLFFLSSCATYQTADLKADLLSGEEIARRYSLDADWWKLYNDPDLNGLIQRALVRNADLARSAIAVNRALYRARLIGADLLPIFSGGGSASADKNLKSGSSDRSFQSQVGVSYELDLWRKLRNAASAQEWEYLATQEDLQAGRLALINSVVDIYFDLRYLNEAIKLTRSNVARYVRLLELTRFKYEAGKVALLEPLQAEQALLAARNSLFDLETRHKDSEQALRDLLDFRPDDMLSVRDTGLMTVTGVGVDLDVPIAALAARPDIRAAENRLQGSFKTLQADRAGWYPNISIGSTLRTSSNTTERFFDVPFLAGTVEISFPFLDWNAVRWQIRISEADFETARIDFTSTVTAALNEVDAAYYAWGKSLQTLDNMVEKHKKDLAIRDYYQTRYEFGAAELKDYLDAQNTADVSMLSALEARYHSIRAENLVFKAMGGRYRAI